MNNSQLEKLFSYGTLQKESVQLSTYNRKLIGHTDTLEYYTLAQLTIIDPEVIKTSGTSSHPIINFTGNKIDKVIGTVFDITYDELLATDAYEVADYKRIGVKLQSGINAWVYVKA